MQVSIVIPTYNRANDLKEAMDSILAQTVTPKEVIIVDDSDNDETENLVRQMMDDFKNKTIRLEYIYNEIEKSLTIARNIGAEHSKGDIVLFLDDDVILGKNYIEEILRVYREIPNALGVQGYRINAKPSKVSIINKLFFLGGCIEKSKCRVLPSMRWTYPYLPDKIISCEWFLGENQSYKRELLQNFRFDENLKRYSCGEDADLSYRVYKRYPNSLYMTPYAKLIHKDSQMGRLPGRQLIYMCQVYKLYSFFKNIDQTLKNKLIFVWSRIGLLIFNFAELVLKPTRIKLSNLKYLIFAYALCTKHLNEIRRGNLGFLNITLED